MTDKTSFIVHGYVQMEDFPFGLPAAALQLDPRDPKTMTVLEALSAPAIVPDADAPPQVSDNELRNLRKQLRCRIDVDVAPLGLPSRDGLQAGIDVVEGVLDQISYLTLRPPRSLHYDSHSRGPGVLTLRGGPSEWTAPAPSIGSPFDTPFAARVYRVDYQAPRTCDIRPLLRPTASVEVVPMKWWRKGQLAHLPEEKFMFWFIVLEMVGSWLLGTAAAVRRRCEECGIDLACPSCKAPSAPVPLGAKAGLKELVLNRLGLSWKTVEPLWRMRNKLFHGSAIDASLRRNVDDQLDTLEFLCLASLNVRTGRAPLSHPQGVLQVPATMIGAASP